MYQLVLAFSGGLALKNLDTWTLYSDTGTNKKTEPNTFQMSYYVIS